MSTSDLAPPPAPTPDDLTPQRAIQVLNDLSGRGLKDDRLRALHHRGQTTIRSFIRHCSGIGRFSDATDVNRDVLQRLLVVQRYLTDLGHAPEPADWEEATRLALERHPIRAGVEESTEFSWIPLYTELAGHLLDFEHRQPELLAILRGIARAELPMIGLTDKDESGDRDLEEIDPFTFFAAFNRGITEQKRRAILERLKAEFGLVSATPTDFKGIPAAQNQQSWFFPYASSRHPDDIPSLWALAKAAHDRPAREVPPAVFQRALAIHTVAIAKLTMGLHWINPTEYLPCDGKTLEYLGAKNLHLEGNDHAAYVTLLDRVRAALGGDFPRISADAYDWVPASSDTGGKRYWAGGFGERAKLAAFLQDGFWQIDWPKDSDRRGARRCWEDFAQLEPGHMLALKGLGGRNDLRIHAVGEITDVDQDAGRVTVRWTDRTPRKMKAPRLAGKGSWFTALVPVTGDLAISQVFGAGAPVQPPIKRAVSLGDILSKFHESPYVFSQAVVRRFHAALHALERKRFVLLTGLSGTGKTLLTKVYAHAYHGIPMGQENPYYRVIPVRPNWNTPRDLLGYYNPIVGRYEFTPFLELLLSAEDDPDHAYFVVLDEMNLAPVEHYLSDVLSAMESQQPIPLWSSPASAAPRPHEGWIEGSTPKEVVRKDLVLWALQNRGGSATTDEVWKRIEDHPLNSGENAKAAMRRSLQELRDGGLVEQGDGAGVWELVEDPNTGQAPRELLLPPNVFLIGTVNVDETTHAFSDKVLDRAFTIELWEVDWDAYARQVDPALRATSAWALPTLRELHRALASQHLDFGYRTADEVLRYVRFRAGDAQDLEALDEAIKMKVLPKVRGDSRVAKTLEEIENVLTSHLSGAAASLAVVKRMRQELRDHGSTRFWR